MALYFTISSVNLTLKSENGTLKSVNLLVNPFTTPVGVPAVTPTERPKSVRNRCVIEVFGSVFYDVTLLFGL